MRGENIMRTFIEVTNYLKAKVSEKVSNQDGVTTLETLLIVIIVVGIVILIVKPNLVSTVTSALGIWAADVLKMFNDAQ